MSMAVVCAHLNLFGPRVVATEAKSSSNCTVASSSTGLIFRPQQNCGDQKGYISLACQASSGGSRRDYEKILARKQKRRVRHMKGVTPSTPDLINTLVSEKRDQAKLDSQSDAVNDDKEYDYEVKEEDEEEFEEEGIPLPLDEAAMLSPEIARASYVGDEHVAQGSKDNKGLGDVAEATANAVADTPGDRVQKSSK